MKCSHKREKQGIVIRFCGELGHHEAAQCVEYLEKTMILYANDPIILDLSGLTFMDSSGIAVVLGAQRNLLGAGQTFCVIRTPPSAMRIFKAAGIQKRVQFLPRICRHCIWKRRNRYAQGNKPDEHQISEPFVQRGICTAGSRGICRTA